jgi:hypothetical protein
LFYLTGYARAFKLEGIFIRDIDGEGQMRIYGPEINQVGKKLIRNLKYICSFRELR